MNAFFFCRCLTCFIALFVPALTPSVVAQAKPQSESGQVKRYEQDGVLNQATSPDNLKVVLLGTGVGPPVNLRQYGASTLIEAGGVRLLFDCGRGATLRLTQVGVPVGSISRLFGVSLFKRVVDTVLMIVAHLFAQESR